MVERKKLDPQRVKETLDEVKRNFIFDNGIKKWADQYALGHMDHYKDIILHVRRIYDAKNITKLLDVGSLPGHIPAILKYACFDIDVVDIKPERARGLFDAMKIPYYKIDIETESMPFPDNTYDLVIFSEVLEHLRVNPLHALKEVKRVLKPGGMCLLSTPQITPLMRWRFLLGFDYHDDIVTEFEKISTIGHMGHIRIYSKAEVMRILNHLDFKVIVHDTGGKLSGKNSGLVAYIIRNLVPDKMKVQLYVWAEKPV